MRIPPGPSKQKQVTDDDNARMAFVRARARSRSLLPPVVCRNNAPVWSLPLSLSLSLGDADPATISTYTGAGISPVVM
jgi:hypothetical protein